MRVDRSAPDHFTIEIQPWQRDLLEHLIPQVRDLLLEGSSPSLRRLFPTAYPGDAEADSAYQELVGDQLLESKLAALDTVEENLTASSLSEDQLLQWMNAVNSLRLVLGTRLDVSEDDDPTDVLALDEDDPERQLWLIYQLLSEMLSVIVDALSS